MANGWTAERRARQAALIQTWKPWEQSTGPRTQGGKLRSSQNACEHNAYALEIKQAAKRLRDLARECKAALALAKKGR